MSDYLSCSRCGCCYVSQHLCIADIQWTDFAKMDEMTKQLNEANEQIKFMKDIMREHLDMLQKIITLL